MQASVVVFTNDARGDLAQASMVTGWYTTRALLGVVTHLHMTGGGKIFAEMDGQ